MTCTAEGNKRRARRVSLSRSKQLVVTCLMSHLDSAPIRNYPEHLFQFRLRIWIFFYFGYPIVSVTDVDILNILGFYIPLPFLQPV